MSHPTREEIQRGVKPNGINIGTDGSGKIHTLTGLAFSAVDPDPASLAIADIAGALSKQCRYAGHCLRFYSVAEHCCLLHDWVFKETGDTQWAFDALMHDATEAYLVDIPRPLKPYLTNYYDIERNLARVIAEKYGLTDPLPEIVKEADNRILFDERAQNMSDAELPEIWGEVPLPILGVRLKLWMPTQAELQFLQRYFDCIDARVE